MVWHGEGAPPCHLAKDTLHEADNHNSIHTGSVVARNKDRNPVAGHQGGVEMHATDGPESLRATNNITIRTWNVRSPRAAGKTEGLKYEMKRYRRNILGRT